MQNIPNAFASWLLSKDSKSFARLKTQSLSVGMQYIVDGIGFTTNWIELDIGANGRRFAVVNIPADYYLALDYRLLNTSSQLAWYHVYPQGTYTLGAVKTNDAVNGLVKTRNLRQDSAFSPSNIVQRYNVTTPPTRLTQSIVDEPNWGAEISGSRSSGSLAPDNTFLLLSPNQQFLLELFNGDGAGLNFQVHLNFALIPESEISPTVI